MTADPSPREAIVRAIEAEGSINGRYSDVQRIGPNAGDGNFSMIFSANDSETEAKVCLKVYDVLNQDAYRIACFERESSVLESLTGQPDVLPLVEPINSFVLTLTVNGNPIPLPVSYFATGLAKGSVADEIRTGASSPLRLLKRFRAMVRSLQRIHAANICHRDLKPGNWLIATKGRIWLADFGTARVCDGVQPALMQDYGMAWRGDLGYSPPEALCGIDDEAIFFVGDFFSLGAALFEMFTGTKLTSYVYDVAFIKRLRQVFALVSPHDRMLALDGTMPLIMSSRPLPSLRQFPNQAPGSIIRRLDRLYQALCHLDWRRRLQNFHQIFLDLQICETILNREVQYLALIAQKEARRKAQSTPLPSAQGGLG